MPIPTLKYVCIMCGGTYPKVEMALENECTYCLNADRLADRIDCAAEDQQEDMETEFNRYVQQEANRKRAQH